ncbi:hypothetical protein I350_07471 [Cryptococcus amylolentus CBS 6273]|uniref:Uncharacterized protein n=1 Tax=Cryptococcus amylolentus CBS 6273 TaxID=1296118 RepID=A0A1E3JF50_9TREE|nr:hypothetical protein I350_07471 [Cryptococcus amylolentus CBS 6273]
MSIDSSSQLVLDDTSPYILYQGDGWSPQGYDVYISQYRNETFHGTVVDGDSATVYFFGTDIQLFGGKRPNHGYYSGQLDGGSKQYFNGTAQHPELYQQVLYEVHGLEDGQHEVVLSNEWMWDADSGGTYLDLDFIALNGSILSPDTITSSASATTSLQSSSSTVSGSETDPSATLPSSTAADSITISGSLSAIQLAATVPPSLAYVPYPSFLIEDECGADVDLIVEARKDRSTIVLP